MNCYQLAKFWQGKLIFIDSKGEDSMKRKLQIVIATVLFVGISHILLALNAWAKDPGFEVPLMVAILTYGYYAYRWIQVVRKERKENKSVNCRR